MPPIRTFTPAKPMKTERTHEENQERAYIAASRRSDRSLEARVESARRASEIHKRRTGRSLRVTEQDVINEEMYEEEDDDLPLQYRRLTAHLQTGSADFNRRLAAYLTNHVAMRSALDQAITQSYAQQYPNAPHFAHNHPGNFPSPLLMQGIPGSPYQAQQSSPRSPHPYRQTPYPMSGTPGLRPPHLQHHRSSSMTLPQEFSAGSQNFAGSPVEGSSESHSRRMSMPASGAPKPDVRESLPPKETQGASSTRSSPSVPVSQLPPIEAKEGSSAQQPHQSPMGPPQPSQHQHYDPTQQYGLSPFTMTLPHDSQMLLGSTLDPNDSFNSMLMAGNNNAQIPMFFDSTSYASSTKPQSNFFPSFEGMNSTLVPSALSLSPSHQATTGGVSPNHLGSMTAADSLPANYGDLKGFEFSASQNSSDGESRSLSDGWDAFINDGSWAESAT